MSLHDPDKNTTQASFLMFLEKSIVNHPSCLRLVTTKTLAEAERLTAGIKVDLDEDLPEDSDEPYI